MELLHHQTVLREPDGRYVCSRCGMVNPRRDTPCVPVDIHPAAAGEDSEVKSDE